MFVIIAENSYWIYQAWHELGMLNESINETVGLLGKDAGGIEGFGVQELFRLGD